MVLNPRTRVVTTRRNSSNSSNTVGLPLVALRKPNKQAPQVPTPLRRANLIRKIPTLSSNNPHTRLSNIPRARRKVLMVHPPHMLAPRIKATCNHNIRTLPRAGTTRRRNPEQPITTSSSSSKIVALQALTDNRRLGMEVREQNIKINSSSMGTVQERTRTVANTEGSMQALERTLMEVEHLEHLEHLVRGGSEARLLEALREPLSVRSLGLARLEALSGVLSLGECWARRSIKPYGTLFPRLYKNDNTQKKKQRRHDILVKRRLGMTFFSSLHFPQGGRYFTNRGIFG
ncbi:unnamed protein product [Tuber aestivum]|uniref:Uncharacterized protein n=1 Tax=Tuber aestivum TaxID=59557 RepID=A0A292PQE8_9PEZI|nr:unnamed protein product [Tuber aestivum]